MSANKRILIFSTAYLPFIGGAEIAVKEITDRLADFDFEIITLNLDSKQKSEERIGRVSVHRIGGSGYFYKLLYPFAALYLARRIHRKQPFDATWSIMASFSGFAALFFKFFYPKIPFILSLQEGDPLERPKRRAAVVWPLFTGIFRQANRIQAISSYLGDFAKSMGAKVPASIIPNGVDLPRFSASISTTEQQAIRSHLPAAHSILITVSRLVEKNGVGDIVTALALLPESVGLLIVGSGPLEQSLKEKVAALQLERRVFFAGFVEYQELPRWLGASDIFIRPSLSEGMGNVFIEAMAVGIPVIATPVGGIVDFLHDGTTGLFCQPKNPQSIAAATTRLLNDAALRQTLVTNGRTLAANYDWKIIAEKMKILLF